VINIYDKEDNLTKAIPIKNMERIVLSPRKHYFVVARRPDEFHPDVQGGILYKEDGTEVWRKEEGPFPVAVSDEGYVISGYLPYESEPQGDFVFYSPLGKETGRIKNPLGKFYGAWGGAKFTADGRNAVIGFTHLGQQSVIIMTTKEGKALWEREIDYRAWTPYEADILEGIGIVGVGVQERPKYEVCAYLIDWEGNLKWMTPLNTKGNMAIKFLQDRKKVFIAATAGYLFCIDIQSGRPLWIHKEKWSPIGAPIPAWELDDMPLFGEIEIVQNKIFVQAYFRRRSKPYRDWYASVLFIFDADNGNLVKKTEYPEKHIYLQSQDSKLFIIDRTSRKISCYEVN
jgi:hypothetical protein